VGEILSITLIPVSWEEFSCQPLKEYIICILFKEVEAQKEGEICPKSQNLAATELGM